MRLAKNGIPLTRPLMTSLHIDTASEITELIKHVQQRTYGRLHDLTIQPTSLGRIQVSAVAHSRFVSQLAEWAVLEKVNSADVDLDIRIYPSTSSFGEIPR